MTWRRRRLRAAQLVEAPPTFLKYLRFLCVADDVAIVKSMNTEQFNHAPAQLFLHTGTQLLGGASMGAIIAAGIALKSIGSCRKIRVT